MNKILIIKPSGIGDIVHSLPVAYGLKWLYPGSRIYWLVFTKFATLLHNTPSVDELILWNRDGGIGEYGKVIKTIRKEKFDLVIDLQGLLRTAIVSFFSGGKKRVAVSLLRECAWLFESPVERFDPKIHAVERNYGIVRYLSDGKFVPAPSYFLPWIHITEQEKEMANRLIKDNKKPLVLFGVGSRGQHKIWPYRNFTELINLAVKEYEFLPLFLGMKEEVELTRKVIDGITCEYIDLTGKTDLRIASALVSFCRLVIGNDSALIHIASALDIPVIGLYGPTDPIQVGPYGDKNKVILKKMPCSPCGIKTRCRVNRCMREITPEEVFNAFKELFFVK
ncbi:MAG: lipopolysaccharide heptosyltransferase II [Candidatus Omnitrophica bacterium]|nr:lipopolysaccharide heptosyltransferase II [Candidatus Omnitrophota bacterium]